MPIYNGTAQAISGVSSNDISYAVEKLTNISTGIPFIDNQLISNKEQLSNSLSQSLKGIMSSGNVSSFM